MNPKMEGPDGELRLEGRTPRGPVVINWTDRWILPILAVGVVLDLLIGGVLMYLGVSTSSTAAKAQKAVASAHFAQSVQYQGCLSQNVERADNKKLWTYLVTESRPQAKGNAAAEKQLDGVQALINKTFAPKNCAPLKPPKSS